jgi:hypothetical protein
MSRSNTVSTMYTPNSSLEAADDDDLLIELKIVQYAVLHFILTHGWIDEATADNLSLKNEPKERERTRSGIVESMRQLTIKKSPSNRSAAVSPIDSEEYWKH